MLHVGKERPLSDIIKVKKCFLKDLSPEVVALNDLQRAVTPGKKLSLVRRVTKEQPLSWPPFVSIVALPSFKLFPRNEATRFSITLSKNQMVGKLTQHVID